MKKAPVILQVLPWLDSGGVERGTVDIACSIVKAGGKALVAAEPGRLQGQLEEAGGELLPLPGRTKNPLRLLFSNVHAIKRMVREYDVDLIHARSRAPAWSAYLAAKSLGLPFVTTYHGAYSQKGRLKAFYNSVMARGDVVIANSDYTADLVLDRNPDAEDRILSIYRGVDMDVFDPASVSADRIETLKSRWGLADRPTIILPSRLTRWKGQSFILPVMGALKEAGSEFQLVLIGDDQGREAYVSELDALVGQHGLEDSIYRVGYCGDMPAAYALADLVIVPSQDAETFGRSAAEALAMGKPVLVGDLGAQPEVVAKPEHVSQADWIACVVRHDDEAGWQEAIAASLASDVDRMKRGTVEARLHIARNFSLQSMGRQTLEVYDSLLGTTLAE